ncbi:hypothetical protein, partial [Pseudomonas sp. S4_EA_1b]|uniref:hypothetical protein n=1 Tax=Pseudomonas sp. S4_EA_1b TaxID=2796960 RepID=UPI001E50F828
GASPSHIGSLAFLKVEPAKPSILPKSIDPDHVHHQLISPNATKGRTLGVPSGAYHYATATSLI